MKAIRHERGFLSRADRFRMECFPGHYNGGEYTQDPRGCTGDEDHYAESGRSTGHPVKSGRPQKNTAASMQNPAVCKAYTAGFLD